MATAQALLNRLVHTQISPCYPTPPPAHSDCGLQSSFGDDDGWARPQTPHTMRNRYLDLDASALCPPQPSDGVSTPSITLLPRPEPETRHPHTRLSRVLPSEPIAPARSVSPAPATVRKGGPPSAISTSIIQSVASYPPSPGWTSTSIRPPHCATGANSVVMRPRSFARASPPAGSLCDPVSVPLQHIKPQQVASSALPVPNPKPAHTEPSCTSAMAIKPKVIAPHLLLRIKTDNSYSDGHQSGRAPAPSPSPMPKTWNPPTPWRQPRFVPSISHEAYLARLDLRPPVLGGRSHKDRLGSVAESWGDDGMGKRYGQFTIEDDPPSRSGSPFMEDTLEEQGAAGAEEANSVAQASVKARGPVENEDDRLMSVHQARAEALERARKGTRYARSDRSSVLGDGADKPPAPWAAEATVSNDGQFEALATSTTAPSLAEDYGGW